VDDQQQTTGLPPPDKAPGGKSLNGKDRPARKIVRFGVFEADFEAGELRRAGVRVKIQAQPFRVLTLLIERTGELVTRDEIVKELWGDGTFVDFDQSVGAVIRKLRLALSDSAIAPRYIETLRHKGYRFLLPIQTDHAPQQPVPPSAGQQRGALPWLGLSLLSIALTGCATAAALIFSVWSARPSESTTSHRSAITQQIPEQPRNVDAWLAYQKGRYLWKTRTAPALEKSIEYFQRAVNLDPDYAAAYAGLADAYVILNFYTGRHRRISIDRARAASGRALKLDDSLAEAHATQAYIKFYYEWDWRGAETAFKKAIALNPTYATAHQWYAEYLFFMGRSQEALRVINRAHELDPQSVVISLQLASPYMFSRDYATAIEKIREALRLDPETPLGIFMLATCYEQLGRFDESLAEYRKIAGTSLGLTGLGYVYGRSGRQHEARRILQQLLDASKRDELSAYHVARVYAGLGDTSQTFAWLRKARITRDERMVMVKVDPKLDMLRADPLFSALLRKLGLA
jgi:tetratricopeptide (TPR) repeat protein/DNA-binding winged helix-turn-helix (wHTH) protein